EGEEAAGAVLRLRRGADAGGDAVPDADAAHHGGGADAEGGGAALCGGADPPDDRRRDRQLRHAGRRADRRAERPDRLCRRPGDRADHPREAARGLPARRIPAGPRDAGPGGAPQGHAGRAGDDPADADRPAARGEGRPRAARARACGRGGQGVTTTMGSPAGSDLILERMMTFHPKVIDLTLDRVHRLLAALDHPESRLPPVIHLAGTNGKGSTQAMIRAGLEAGGARVHAYTSPHLARFHERIRLAGELISEPALAAALDECVAANGGEEITFFEITTCAALLAFSRTPADFTLLEVGLGGRLDATNVVEKPALTVITPVSIDHQQYLGETLAEIAGEKAGIIKRGVPCVVGPQEAEGLAVIEAKAARLGARLWAHGQHWTVAEERGRLVYQDENGLLD